MTTAIVIRQPIKLIPLTTTFIAGTIVFHKKVTKTSETIGTIQVLGLHNAFFLGI